MISETSFLWVTIQERWQELKQERFSSCMEVESSETTEAIPSGLPMDSFRYPEDVPSRISAYGSNKTSFKTPATSWMFFLRFLAEDPSVNFYLETYEDIQEELPAYVSPFRILQFLVPEGDLQLNAHCSVWEGYMRLDHQPILRIYFYPIFPAPSYSELEDPTMFLNPSSPESSPLVLRNLREDVRKESSPKRNEEEFKSFSYPLSLEEDFSCFLTCPMKSSGYLKESLGIPEGISSGYLKESLGIPEGISSVPEA